jgi:hypothetical protein
MGLVGALFALSPAVLWAQQFPQQSALLSTPKVKEYGRPGYPQITVYVWGSADTGVWNVEQGTDLLEFASVISQVPLRDGGPEQKVTNRLQIYRDEPVGGQPFFEARIAELFTQRGTYPELKEGDILVLDTEVKGRFTWRDVAQVVGTVGTLLNTFLIIDRLRNN